MQRFMAKTKAWTRKHAQAQRSAGAEAVSAPALVQRHTHALAVAVEPVALPPPGKLHRASANGAYPLMNLLHERMAKRANDAGKTRGRSQLGHRFKQLVELDAPEIHRRQFSL